jgi:hypothetical protein
MHLLSQKLALTVVAIIMVITAIITMHSHRSRFGKKFIVPANHRERQR